MGLVVVRLSGSRPLKVREGLGELPLVEQGKAGLKASGMLCVDGTFYMLARNASNSQIAWSKDHGRTWTWYDWKFETSFGAPTFMNYGRDYAEARDDYIYIY